MERDSPRSRIGLNAANFLQAEAVGVVLPILNTFLKEAHWRYDQIGLATAIAGLGTLLFQTPAGYLVDKLKSRRALFAVTSLGVGTCFGLIPFVPRTAFAIDSLLFLSGVLQSLFVPLLAALAMAMAGHKMLNRTLGENQGWNHAGNIAAALIAFFAVGRYGSESVFFAVAFASLLGAGSVFLIRRDDLNEERASGDGQEEQGDWKRLLSNRTVLFLLLSVGAFHLANAPIMPMTALYIKELGGSDRLTTFTVLSAQAVMVPVAWLTGKLCDSWGRKPTLAIAFWVLPARIVSYTFAHNAHMVVLLQALDGIGAGIYGVAIVAFAADLARGKGYFNTLMGIFATAQAIGGVAGPFVQGLLLQHFGFRVAFLFFAALALAGAILYQTTVPETTEGKQENMLRAAPAAS